MSAPAREGDGHLSKHEAAVADTLRQADEAAGNGDYPQALSWLQLIDAIGDALPEGYELKRRAWLAEIAQYDGPQGREAG